MKQLLARVRSRRPAALTQGDGAADGDSHDLVSLEARLDSELAAAENGEEWCRDPAVIRAELDAVQEAIRVAADLGTGTPGNEQVTRKEFEAFKAAVAAAFVGIYAAIRDSTVSPRSILEAILAVSAEIGLSPAHSQEISGLLQKIDVVNRQYGNWDNYTASARREAARVDRRRAPPGI